MRRSGRPRWGLVAALASIAPATADETWTLRAADSRPLLVHRDGPDPRLDDRLRLACLRGGGLVGEVPLGRLQEQGRVNVVRLRAGPVTAQGPAYRAERERGPVLRFRIDDGRALIDALGAADRLDLSILRVTYSLAFGTERAAVDAYRTACRAS